MLLELKSERISLAILSEDDAPRVQQYMLENRAHLEPWEPLRTDSDFETEKISERLKSSAVQFQNDSAYHFAIIDNQSGEVIGACNFNNIVRGVFQACHLGFSIAKSHEGRGVMYEALTLGIPYMFETIGLHRIMSNHLPNNERSARLLKRLGFENEGYAKSYLRIAGVWQDHVLTALVNPKER